MKRSMFFTIDALLASMLIAMTVIVAISFFSDRDDSGVQLTYVSEDLIGCLASIRVHELGDSYPINVTNPNSSIIEQIGEYYVSNQTALAENLSAVVLRDLVPSRLGFSLLINDEPLLEVLPRTGRSDQIASSKRMVSGFEKFRPLKGSTSKVFLEGINEKVSSSYLYFGGFVGQGNITSYLDGIPADASISELVLEMSAGAPFDVLINGMVCNTTFYPSGISMEADSWDVSSCSPSLVPGTPNNISVIFHGAISDAYIGGGFLKAKYNTSAMIQEPLTDKRKEYLPGIDGIVNLYSSFYVPGEPSSMTVHLEIFANNSNSSNSMYLTIANTTVLYLADLDGAASIDLSDANLSSQLHYSLLAGKTVPVRLGFENVSFGYIFEGNGDVAIVTDVSGSMDWRMDADSTFGAVPRNCDTSGFNDSTTTRLSVAKCLDKQFSRDIINITGNTVALVSYDDSTHNSETVYPTTDLVATDAVIGTAVPETGYEGSGGTCICCGINSAITVLAANLATQTLIPAGSSWSYNFSKADIPADAGGNDWYEPGFVSYWPEGSAVLGATNGYAYSPAVVTEMGSDLTGQTIYVDLWEHRFDAAGPPADFSSNILNYTANTYGISGADDGWDWDPRNGAGPFGYDDDLDYGISSGRIHMDNNYGGSGNICSGRDCSGAFGIRIEIDDDVYNIVRNGTAILSFQYDWDDRSWNYFEDSDHAWIKARWTSTAASTYLGSDLDSNMAEHDADNDIASVENPDADMSGTFAQDIAHLITGPGTYYLEIGSKILANDGSEYGTFYFDNIQLALSNVTDTYYLRKDFTISSLGQVQKAILNMLSDDFAKVYINGNLAVEKATDDEGRYWNVRGRSIPQSFFREGENVIAVQLLNSTQAAKFDLELIGLNSSRDQAIMVMTDGVANYECTPWQHVGDGDSRAVGDAIAAACRAREDYGMTVYSVGYSDTAEETSLEAIAKCGEGIYTKSKNVSALEEFYQDVASTIVSAARHAQTITVQGELQNSILYPTSYIEIDYTPIFEADEFGEISVVIEEKMSACDTDMTIPDDIRIADARLTSYSADHWTDEVIVNGAEVYNLSDYNPDYTSLGDPFAVEIPASLLHTGLNTMSMRTGDSYINNTGCSANNSFIYTALVRSTVSYSDVLENAEGCVWTIEFDSGKNTTVSVPPSYAGPKHCYYTSSQESFDPVDTYDDAMYRLLLQLDLDDDGRIFVDLEEHHFVIGAISVGKIPYPWGPAIAEVRTWR